MERRNNWLGYIAIALGTLALVVALGARVRGPNITISVPSGMAGVAGVAGVASGPSSPPAVAAVPPSPRAPQSSNESGGDFGQHFRGTDQGSQQFGGRSEGRQQFQRGNGPAFTHGHRPPFFFAPFFIFGSLLKLLIAVALIGFGLRLLRRRGGPRGPHGDVTPPPDEPQMASMPARDGRIHYM